MHIGMTNIYFGRVNQLKPNFGSSPIGNKEDESEGLKEAERNFKTFIEDGKKIIGGAREEIKKEHTRLLKDAEQNPEYKFKEKKQEIIDKKIKGYKQDLEDELRFIPVPDYSITLQRAEEKKYLEKHNIPELADKGDPAAILIMWAWNEGNRLSGEGSITADKIIPKLSQRIFRDKAKEFYNSREIVFKDRDELKAVGPELDEHLKTLKAELEKNGPSEEIIKAKEEYKKAAEEKRQEIIASKGNFEEKAKTEFNKEEKLDDWVYSEKLSLINDLIREDLESFKSKKMPRQLRSWIEDKYEEDRFSSLWKNSDSLPYHLNPKRIILETPIKETDMGITRGGFGSHIFDNSSGNITMEFDASDKRYFKNIKFEGMSDNGEEKFELTIADPEEGESKYTLVTGSETVDGTPCARIIPEDGSDVKILEYNKRFQPWIKRHKEF